LLGLFAPDTLTSIFGLQKAVPTVWARDAGLFLIFVSLFYIPAARDPFRYRFNAYLLVIARLGYVVFWFAGVWLLPDFGPEYLKFGILDLLFAVPQAILLILMFRTEGKESGFRVQGSRSPR
jgi:hypothetical protein